MSEGIKKYKVLNLYACLGIIISQNIKQNLLFSAEI